MNKNFLLIVAFLFISRFCFAQNFILPLWEGNIPNYQKTDEVEISDSSDVIRISNVQNPDIDVYLPSNKDAIGKAVVICPGGGYEYLAYDFEGSDVAKFFNSQGIAAVVLKYRLPVSKSNIVGYKSPLLDVQRAMRLTRYHASEWNINKDEIGIIGFSAGGHLASTLGTHFDYGIENSDDPVDKISCRPDFMILMYPVITFAQPFMHKGSRDALLGISPDSSLMKYFSNELQVKEDTPPTFIVHASDDGAVPVQNSLVFYKALVDKGISAEMHIYPEGGHGFSLATWDDHLHSWTQRCIDWLKWIDEGNISK